ncbi:MAG: PVC-type heme-binding CxxCH protein [Bacteroidota bacterium]
MGLHPRQWNRLVRRQPQKWFYRPDKPSDIQSGVGRDFFHHPGEGYWRREGVKVLQAEGAEVSWQTVYWMLGEAGDSLLRETQTWTLTEAEGKYLLSLDWQGEAPKDFTVNEFEYGGMFLRMPWEKSTPAQVVNAARQRDQQANRKQAMWLDVGMEIEGLDQWGHLTIFDHPENEGFPTAWRVDGQYGVGPCRAISGDWQIKAGESLSFQHQLVVYTGELSDVEMNERWAEFAGDDGMYNKAALWSIAQKEAREAVFLSPEAAVQEMTLKEGYEVNAFASEPMITQPMAFCWDDRGRLWIAENRDYESRGHGFSNSGDSRILILEDTDRDGVADKRTVFLEGIPFPSAIAVGFGGLYLGAPPNLLFVPDRDGDDKADEADIQVLLTGWGIRDRHETINSLHWGPDGWLYGLEGFATPSKIRKPADGGRIYRAKEAFPEDLLEADGTDINGGIWRYHPVKDRFEVVAHGLSNPWGIDHDAKGQLFISACVIPHLFHIIPGGIYQRQGGSHFNPYVYRDIQTIVDHRHRSAHGGARIYQSDAFPAEQKGRIFMANIHEHAVLSDILNPNGSGFTASHGEDFLQANNGQWIGFSMEIGPEGGLYVLDWHDADICGKEVLNKETGRVYRIMPTESQAQDFPGRYEDLKQFSDLQLAQLQESPSDWHARRSRLILQERAVDKNISTEAAEFLHEVLASSPSPDHQLRALWALHLATEITREQLLSLTENADPYLRGWAVQLLCEDGTPSPDEMERFLVMAQNESSPVARLYLTAALQRIAPDQVLALAGPLTQYAEDQDDPNLSFMLWFGIEPQVVKQPGKALEIAGNSQVPILSELIARRLVDGEKSEALVQALGERGGNQKAMLQGMLAALNGRSNLHPPANWEATYALLQQDRSLASLATQVSQQYGDAAAIAGLWQELKDANNTAAQRQAAIRLLAQQKDGQLLDQLPGLLQDPTLRTEAIRAVAQYEDKQLGQLLLDQYEKSEVEEQEEIIQTLASRAGYGYQLAYAIKDEQIPRSDIPAYLVRQLRRVVGNGFVEIWGPIDALQADKQASYATYQALLTDEALADANPAAGKALFQQQCGACHQLYGEGGQIGPDLTGSNRTNTAYLLGNLIEPSSEIQDDYRLVFVTTQDGRTYSGNVIGESDRQLTMRIAGQGEVILSQSDVLSREVSPNSLMPEGLLDQLSEQEVLDLIGYLKTEVQ